MSDASVDSDPSITQIRMPILLITMQRALLLFDDSSVVELVHNSISFYAVREGVGSLGLAIPGEIPVNQKARSCKLHDEGVAGSGVMALGFRDISSMARRTSYPALFIRHPAAPSVV